MKQLNATELKRLKYGQKVIRFQNGESRELQFVGIMPSCKNYLIFEDGEYLTHLHISSNDDSFQGEWYAGEYSSKFVGNLKIEWLQNKIESIKHIYLKQK